MKKMKNILMWLGVVCKMNWKMVVLSGMRMIFQMVEPFCLIVFPSLILNEISSTQNAEIVVKYIIVMVSMYASVNSIIAILNHLLITQDMKSSNEFGRMLSYKHMTMAYDKCESNEALNLLQKFYFPLQPESFLRTIESFVSSVLQIIIILLTGGVVNFLVIGVIIIAMLVQNAVVKQAKQLELKYQDEQSGRSRKMKYISDILTDYSFSKDLHINGGSTWLKKMFEELLETYMGSFRLFSSKMTVKSLFLNIIDSVQELLFMLIVGVNIIISSMVVGYYTLGIGFANRLKGATLSLINSFNTLMQTSEYIDLYKKYESFVPNDVRETERIRAKQIEIEFKNVSFMYPGSDCFALKNINLNIKTGSKVALVGENGSGKSTLCKLICRLYHPTEGSITLNGIDIYKYKKEDYMLLLSVFLQDYKLLALTIRENIAYDNTASDYELVNCLEKAGLKSKILSLSDALDTYLFKDFSENGIELSGGESQKLIYARELFKDRQLVLLDEPTAALDPVSEYEFYDQVRSFSKNKTYIYVSHRLYGVRFADCIYVFKKGEIVESGSHKTLMEKKGEYFSMFSKQADLYK